MGKTVEDCSSQSKNLISLKIYLVFSCNADRDIFENKSVFFVLNYSELPKLFARRTIVYGQLRA